MVFSLVKNLNIGGQRKEVGRRREGDPWDCPTAEKGDKPFGLATDHS